MSAFWKAFTKLGVTFLTNAAYHSQTNGQLTEMEKANRINSISELVADIRQREGTDYQTIKVFPINKSQKSLTIKGKDAHMPSALGEATNTRALDYS